MNKNVTVIKNKQAFSTKKTSIFDSSQRVYRLAKNAVQTKNKTNINDTVNTIFVYAFSS